MFFNTNQSDVFERGFEELENQLSRFFLGRDNDHEFPAINLVQKDDKALLAASLPGVHPENLEINVSGNVLSLSGSRYIASGEENESSDKEDDNFKEGVFSRNVRLPFMINSNAVSASLKNGILYLDMPKAESEKPRKIQIQENK